MTRRITQRAGRWLVVHRVPGADTWHIDADCPTEAAARAELARLAADDAQQWTWIDTPEREETPA